MLINNALLIYLYTGSPTKTFCSRKSTGGWLEKLRSSFAPRVLNKPGPPFEVECINLSAPESDFETGISGVSTGWNKTIARYTCMFKEYYWSGGITNFCREFPNTDKYDIACFSRWLSNHLVSHQMLFQPVCVVCSSGFTFCAPIHTESLCLTFFTAIFKQLIPFAYFILRSSAISELYSRGKKVYPQTISAANHRKKIWLVRKYYTATNNGY